MVKQFVFGIALLIGMVGCASEPKVRTVYQTVEVPVAPDLPVVVVPERPVLPVNHIDPNDSPEEIGKAYRLTIEILKGHVVELETLLDPYTTK